MYRTHRTPNPARAAHRDISGPDGFAATLTPFTGSNLRGVEGAYWGHGRLSGATYDRYYDDRAADRIVYTVVSYSTPIAWVLRDGTRVRPADKYSVTTSKQQGLLAWLGLRHPVTHYSMPEPRERADH